MKHEHIIYPWLYIAAHPLFYCLCLCETDYIRYEYYQYEAYIETNKTANGARRDVTLFYVQTDLRFHGTSINTISFTAIK